MPAAACAGLALLRLHIAITATMASTIETAHRGRTKIHDSTMVTLASTAASTKATPPVNMPTARPSGGSTAAMVLSGPSIIEKAIQSRPKPAARRTQPSRLLLLWACSTMDEADC